MNSDLVDVIFHSIMLALWLMGMGFAVAFMINMFVYKSEEFQYWEKAAITALASVLGGALVVALFVQNVMIYRGRRRQTLQTPSKSKR